jgi:pilus assembly protein Flp/PilA
MNDLMRRFAREDGGATMVEYGIMVGLISAVCIATIALLGGEVRDLFSSVEADLADPIGNAPPPD